MRYLGDPQTWAQTIEGIERVQSRWQTFGYGWWSMFIKDTDTLIGAACLQNLAHVEKRPARDRLAFDPRLSGVTGYATEAGSSCDGLRV